MSNYINNSIAMNNGQSITEDSVLADPNINTSNLAIMSSVAPLGMTKVQPHNLASDIQGAGNSGATLMIQNTNSGQITHMTNKFYLQAMDMTFKERIQIMETFGKPIASFFGETARVYNFSGVALEADTQNKYKKGEYFHGTSLMYLYNEFMRGTKLVDTASIAILNVANHSVYGYPIQFSYRALSDMAHAVQFSISMFVKDHLWEIPQVVDRATVEKNVYMNRSDHPNVKRLVALRTGPLNGMMKKIETQAVMDRKIHTHDPDATPVAAFATGAVDLAGDMLDWGIDKINAERFTAFRLDLNNYISSVKEIYAGRTPTDTQAAQFGFLGPSRVHITDPNADWTDNFFLTANTAFQWMPWANTAGASNVLTQDDIDNVQDTITSDTMLSDQVAKWTSLEPSAGYEEAEKNNASDAEKGNYAGAFRQLLTTVDATILKKLAYYATTEYQGNVDRDVMI